LKNKVSIKGAFLPNVGGISIHISRLAERLANENQLECVYNTSVTSKNSEVRFKVKNSAYPFLRYGIFQSILWFFMHGIKDKARIIHMHDNPIWELPTIIMLLILKKKLVYTIHDQMMLGDVNYYPKLLSTLFKKLINNKNIRWIAVNHTIKAQIENISLKCINIPVIPAYIPSISDDNPLNPEIENFIKSKSKIVSIYANYLRKLNNKDLYGIDLALKAIAKAKKHISDIGLVISIPNAPLINSDQVKSYNQIIHDLKLSDNVLMYFKPVNNPISLWRRCDIVLRPTLTDGDSLVIREALSQGTFVIASDVVKRPDEVILFKSENIDELSTKIIETLFKNRSNSFKTDTDNYLLIKEIYASI
jgi:glycosyltransferase involved in cell wall biosynthesis